MNRALLSSWFCVFIAACAAQEFDDPISVMTDRDESHNWRMDAAKQAQRRFPDDPRRIAALHSLVWDRGHPTELRIYAIDQLIALDEKDFRAKLDRRIVLIDEGPPIEHVYKLALGRGWGDFTPAVVKRWSVPVRGVGDMDRADRRMIEKLNPGKPVEQVVFEVFALPDERITPVQRVAAWSLLNRLTDTQTLSAYLAQAPDATALVVDLKACAAELGTLPRNREGVRWLFFLRDPSRAAYWRSAATAAARLSPQQRQGFELRHIAVMPHADDDSLRAGRDDLFREVEAAIRQRESHRTGPDYDAPMKDYPQLLRDWEERITWADLVTMKTIWRIVSDADVKAALFEQADADVKDEGTERGGVLDIIDGRPIARAYLPILRLSHNRKFTPTEQMIEHCYTAVAHYHFHAQDHKNATYAGPGYGDIQTADNIAFNFVVFTFIDENRLNVDYYRRDGVVVDLGTIYR